MPIFRLMVTAASSAAIVLSLLLTDNLQAAEREMLTIPAQSLEIPAGSPLDFSRLASDRLAGSEGWVVPSSDGRLHFAGSKRRAKFSCAMSQGGPHATYTFHENKVADRYAIQLRRHGYDLLRFQYLDARLMSKRKDDFDVDPVQLERFDYLLSTLAKHGVYWGIDLLSRPEGLTADGRAAAAPDTIRSRMLFDPEARRHWLKAIDLLYGRRNPYTGQTTLEDPALAFVVTFNENSLGFARSGKRSDGKPFPTGIEVPFNDWLAATYPDTASLSKDLSDRQPDETIEGRNIRLPASWDDTSRRMLLFHRFVTKLEIDTWNWTVSELRKRGFKGVVLAYDDYYKHINNATRSHLPVVDVHGYSGAVTDYTLGRKWVLGSSLDRDSSDWRAVAANRWLDRPFTVTEYGQSFWNPYRYEAGVVLPAIAALQDWDLICRTAHSSVELDIPDPIAKSRPILPYGIGIDPVARAGETVAVLLFARGDVTAATKPVAVPFGAAQFARLNTGNIPSDIRIAALLTRFGLQPSDRLADLPPSAVVVDLPAYYGVPASLSGQIRKTLSLATGTGVATLVNELRAKNVLPANNKTDPSRHLFQSATGELLLDGEKGVFFVTTPQTEAAALKASTIGYELGRSRVEQLSSDALFAVSSLDGREVTTSGRLLIILAGDAENSDMIFTDSSRTALKSWGQLPVRLQRVFADVSLESARKGKVNLSALNLNGTVSASLPIQRTPDGKLSFRVDTAAVVTKPTTFFLLEID